MAIKKPDYQWQSIRLFEISIKEKSKYEAISVSKKVLTYPYRGYATKF